MDYEAYRQKFFVEPSPEPRFRYDGLHGVTLFYQNYEAAVDFFQKVLGPPAYVEGPSTRGWRIGGTWLTLLRSENGNPTNVEAAIVMPTPAEAEHLQAVFIEAGRQGPAPSDQLMYEPIRCCPVTDPFGVDFMIYSRLLED